MEIHLYLGHLDAVLTRLDELKALLTQQGATMAATMDDLKAEVAKVSDVEQSALVLINGLRDQLKAAQAASDPAAIQAVIDALDAKATELAAAVAGPSAA